MEFGSSQICTGEFKTGDGSAGSRSSSMTSASEDSLKSWDWSYGIYLLDLSGLFQISFGGIEFDWKLYWGLRQIGSKL